MIASSAIFHKLRSRAAIEKYWKVSPTISDVGSNGPHLTMRNDARWAETFLSKPYIVTVTIKKIIFLTVLQIWANKLSYKWLTSLDNKYPQPHCCWQLLTAFENSSYKNYIHKNKINLLIKITTTKIFFTTHFIF